MRRALSQRHADSGGAIDERRTEPYYWWLLLTIVFEYARPGAFVPILEAAKLNSLIPLSLFTVVLFAPGLRPLEQIFADRFSRWLIAFLLLILLSVPFADVTLYSFEIFKKVLGYVFLFFIIARVATSVRRLHGIFVTLVLAHLFLILMNPGIVTTPGDRIAIQGGTFLGDGNDFSLSLCILIPMVIEIALSARSRLGAILTWAALLVILFAIIGTQSRGAALGVVSVLGFLFLLSKRKFASLAGMLLVGIVVSLYASDEYFTRMNTMADYENESSAQGRIIAWKASARMALDHPLLGVGAGHFPVAFGSQYQPRELGFIPWITAHSMYFLVLGELGIPGIIVVLVLVFGGIRATLDVRRRVLRSNSDPPWVEAAPTARLLYLLAASGIGLAVSGAFLSATYYPHIFVLTGITLAARSIALAGMTTVPKSSTRPRSLSAGRAQTAASVIAGRSPRKRL